MLVVFKATCGGAASRPGSPLEKLTRNIQQWPGCNTSQACRHKNVGSSPLLNIWQNIALLATWCSPGHHSWLLPSHISSLCAVTKNPFVQQTNLWQLTVIQTKIFLNYLKHKRGRKTKKCKSKFLKVLHIFSGQGVRAPVVLLGGPVVANPLITPNKRLDRTPVSPLWHSKN